MKPIYNPIKSIDARIKARNRRRMILKELLSAVVAGIVWLTFCLLFILYSHWPHQARSGGPFLLPYPDLPGQHKTPSDPISRSLRSRHIAWTYHL